ncbi:SMP-30/gluconolactonase/LRE family protein [Labrys neptuniae]
MSVSRRNMMLAVGGLAATAMTRPAAAAVLSEDLTIEPFQQSARYPDPRVQALDPEFNKYIVYFAAVERIATGHTRYIEGPVWFGDGRYLVWSDIPNNRMLKWDEESGAVSIFRQPSNYANGNIRDRQGRLITCEHGRRVTRTEHDGTITVLADKFEGKPFNSPNDVVVKSDDSIWFTDPPFGILGTYAGNAAKPELPYNVYRLDPATKALTVVATDVAAPNGLAFSPDEKLLYIVDSFAKPVTIRLYDVTDNGTKLANPRIFFTSGEGGAPDGIRCDVDGNVWAAYGEVKQGMDCMLVISPKGKSIGKISLPERPSNLCFGGPKKDRLFMTAGRAVYSLYVNTTGAGLYV